MKRGLILNNVGTPEAPTREAVKRYLDEFLMDPSIIGAPFLIRWILVKGIITPRRSYKSAEKYRSIWTKNGSPLLSSTISLQEKIQEELGTENWIVRIGMRYGSPSIENALVNLKKEGVEEIFFAPLFPQYAESSSGTSIGECRRVLKKLNWSVPLRILSPFYDHPSFIKVQADRIRPYLEADPQVLFSFHGLPESHVRKTPGCLRSVSCCEVRAACEKNCYRAQSFRTAGLLARELGLSDKQWRVGFQSRLGPTRWIGPSTDSQLKDLAHRGLKNVVVACPSFVTDCLETLEEIGIGAREDFISWGGESLQLAPCVNDDEQWIKVLPAVLEGSHVQTY